MQIRSKFADVVEIKRHINIPQTSFFLFGPRGTGKSTFVKGLIKKDTLYIDFLDPETFRTFSAFSETLIKTVSAVNPACVILISWKIFYWHTDFLFSLNGQREKQHHIRNFIFSTTDY